MTTAIARPVPTEDAITVREAIIEAIAGTDRPEATHGQLCPVYTRARTIWACDCWRFEQIERMAAAICARLDGES